MLEIAGVAFATLFATVSPVSVAPMFAALTAKATPAARRSMAWRGVLIATCILLVFALFGQSLLARLGISVAALRTAVPAISDVRGIVFTRFLSEDVVRHPLVQRIVNAYETHHAQPGQ